MIQLAWAIATALTTALVAVPAPAQEAPLVFAPSAPWAIDSADESCRLTRTFVNDRNAEITLALERFAPEELMLIGFSSTAIQSKPGALTAVVRFGPNGSEDEWPLYGAPFSAGRYSYMIFPTMLDPSVSGDDEDAEWLSKPFDRGHELEVAARVETLMVSDGFTRPIELPLGPMAEPLKAMHDCLDDLIKHWGLDSAAHQTLTRRATQTNYEETTAIISKYYGSNAVAPDIAALIRLRVLLDRDGNATQCVVIGPHQPNDLVDFYCQVLLKHARFKPALDAAGLPIASFYLGTLSWRPKR